MAIGGVETNDRNKMCQLMSQQSIEFFMRQTIRESRGQDDLPFQDSCGRRFTDLSRNQQVYPVANTAMMPEVIKLLHEHGIDSLTISQMHSQA